MKILSIYISKTIISAILIIALILMGIELLISFIGELNNIGVGNYGPIQALRYVILDMPYQLSGLFPMAGLVGSLLGLGVLASQSELIVMRASGFSTGQIIFSVLQAALFIALISMLIGEIIAPYTENLATTGRAIAKSGGQAVATKQGIWIRERQHGNEFIHIQKVVTKKHIEGIISYNFDAQNNLISAFTAEQANFHQGVWQLSQVNFSQLKDNGVVSKVLPTMQWQINLDPNLLEISDADPRNMSLLKLENYIRYLKMNGLGTPIYQLAFWKRIFQPISSIVMIFLAIPFVFGPLRTVPMGVRVVAGISVGFCFYILNQFFGPLSSLYQIPPFIGAALPTILFLIAGFFFMARVR